MSLITEIPSLASEMLSDRSYMRDDYQRPTTSALTWLLCVLISGFVLKTVLGEWIAPTVGSDFVSLFGLNAGAVKAGQVWRLVSYCLLHSNILQLIVNLLGIYFLGRELIQLWGQKRFFSLFFLATLAGGLVWLAVHWSTGGGPMIGTTAALVALLVSYACINPDQQITLLLFFVMPITVKTKWIATAVVLFDVLGFLFLELPGKSNAIYYSNHLGGVAVGWLFYYFIHRREWRTPDALPEIELPRWLRKSKQAAVAPANYKVNLTSREDLRAEVDRILDKINSEGFGALTADEKRLLDEAKDLLSRP